MSDKIKYLVCGTNFGRFYINTCSESKKLELSGVLSKGSEHSKKEAKDKETTLFTDVNDIAKDKTDAAVVAARTLITGGKSADTVTALLNKGVHVLQEQPVHIQEIQGILNKTKGCGAGYFVNNFYRFLPATEIFIQKAKQLFKDYKVLRLRMSCSSQVLYPLVDVMYEILGGIEDFSVDCVSESNMSILTGYADGMPVVLDYYNEYSDDADGSLALFFDIKLDTDAGNLILDDPEGSVVWQSHLTYDKESRFDDEKFGRVRPLEILFDSDISSYAERYTKSWPAAIEKSLISFYEQASDGEGRKELEKRVLKQCEICSLITNKAGRPKKAKVTYINSVSFM